MEFLTSFSPLIIAMASILGGGWFLRRWINRTDNKIDEYRKDAKSRDYTVLQNYKDLNDKIDKKTDQLKDKIQEIYEKTTIIDAKQERLDIFSVKIDAIHAAVKENFKKDKEHQLLSIENERKLKIINDKIKTLEDIDNRVKFIFDSDIFDEKEKREIRDKINSLKKENDLKIIPFISFLEQKIIYKSSKEEFEHDDLKMIELTKRWRVSKGLLDDIEEKKVSKG